MDLPTEVNTRAKEITHQHPGISYNDLGRAGEGKTSEFAMANVTVYFRCGEIKAKKN